MESSEFTFINEEFFAEKVCPEDLCLLLAKGWRHFGKYFFRYSVAYHADRYRRVLPLRIRLSDFTLSKSQRRVLRLNADLTSSIETSRIDTEKQRLFEIHKQRFRGPSPDSILSFLDRDPGNVPCPGLQFAVRDSDGGLLAVSFADEASNSLSSIYAMFDPEQSQRSLGIFTLLLEIEHAKKVGKKHHYLGYAYEGSSFYDYKKRFSATECYDWSGNWQDYDGR